MDAVLLLACFVACPLLAGALPVLIMVMVGRARRSQLEQEVATREQQVAHLLATTTSELAAGKQVTLVVGTVVYSPDPAARTKHKFRRLLGGTSASITQRVQLARRLATLRALEQANQLGARAVVNLRYQTSSLSQPSARNKGQRPLVELIAYGTAWVPQ